MSMGVFNRDFINVILNLKRVVISSNIEKSYLFRVKNNLQFLELVLRVRDECQDGEIGTENHQLVLPATVVDMNVEVAWKPVFFG